MNLYLISQDINNNYDTYDAAVVAAESEDDARAIHPSPYVTHISCGAWMGTHGVKALDNKAGKEYPTGNVEWVDYKEIDKITVQLIGTTDRERGVVLASFNAG